MKRFLLILFIFNSAAIAMDRGAAFELVEKQAADRLGEEIVDVIHLAIGQMLTHGPLNQFPQNLLNRIKSLLAQGPNLNIVAGEMTPLILAAKIDQLPLVKLFIENGADVNGQNEKQRNALIAICDRGFTSKAIIKYLIEEGIDVNAQDNEGKTALMYAAQKANVEAVDLLLEGMKVKTSPSLSKLEKSKTYFQLLPADVIGMADAYVKTVANPNLVSDEGKSALDYANDGYSQLTKLPESNNVLQRMSRIREAKDYSTIRNLLIPVTYPAKFQRRAQQQSQKSWWQRWKRQ